MKLAESTLSGLSNAIAADAGLLAQIVDVSADAIFSEDLTGKIRSWNAGAERLYGCAAADMLGRSAADLLPAETATQLRSVHELALSGQRVERFDTWHQRPDGRHVAVSLTVSPLHESDGAIAGLATSVKDVTDRVQLTSELEAVHRTLEKQYVALSRSNRDLEQFAYVASHDLSEPLRVMSAYAQLLEKRYDDLLDERGRGYIAQVMDGAVRMRTLIEDLLEYSRFLSSAAPAIAVDPNAVARKVAASLDAPDVMIEPMPDVWCDKASITAVLQNLISNALKFRRPDEAPRVQVSASRVGDRVQINVDDNGIGILPEYRDRVFRMFNRLHVREAYAGTGIGLAIVQQIAERSDGRAWIESSPLGGSRFCVTFPSVPAQVPPDAAAAQVQEAQ
jgi:PAS domain S-box-containing protein